MTQKEKSDWKTIGIGILALTILEVYALYLGHNGTILKTVLIIIGLAIGVTIPNPIKK